MRRREALFGEKYAEKVRVLTLPGFLEELAAARTCARRETRLIKITSDDPSPPALVHTRRPWG